MAKKSAVIKGGRFTQVDGQWLVALPIGEPLAVGATIEVIVKSGKAVPFMVQGIGGDASKTIFAVLSATNEIVYFGTRLDK
jgi:hypothetical protein